MVNPQPVGHASQSFLSFNHRTKTGVQWHDVLQLDKINPTFFFCQKTKCNENGKSHEENV